MSLPRPLVIVLFVVLLLALVGCVFTGVGLLAERDLSPADRENQVRGGGPADFLRGLAPRSAPVRVEPTHAACFNPATSRLTFTTTCFMSIPATTDLRRELALAVQSGQVAMTVTMFVDGAPQPSQTATVPDDTNSASLVLGRGDRVDLALACISPVTCVLRVNP